MAKTVQVKAKLEGTDILFECRECGKSLAIDRRGAGLNIHCPHCDSELEVPIPEGFDLEQLDKEITAADPALEEEVNAGAISIPTIEAPSAAPAQDIAASKELETLRAQNKYLTQQHADMLKTVKAVQLQVREFNKALDELSEALDALTGPQADETQRLV